MINSERFHSKFIKSFVVTDLDICHGTLLFYTPTLSIIDRDHYTNTPVKGVHPFYFIFLTN